MSRHTRRTPRGYDGSGLTAHHIRDLLPSLLHGIGESHQNRGDLILAAWPEIIGRQLSPMTQAIAFDDGFLTVKVKNSTLYSLLSQHEKPKILKSLRSKFPQTFIKNIIFRIG